MQCSAIKKPIKIKQAADLVVNLVDFFSQDNPDLKNAVRYVKNWEGPDGKKYKKPSLLIGVDKLDMVQDVFGFDLETE